MAVGDILYKKAKSFNEKHDDKSDFQSDDSSNDNNESDLESIDEEEKTEDESSTDETSRESNDESENDEDFDDNLATGDEKIVFHETYREAIVKVRKLVKFFRKSPVRNSVLQRYCK